MKGSRSLLLPIFLFLFGGVRLARAEEPDTLHFFRRSYVERTERIEPDLRSLEESVDTMNGLRSGKLKFIGLIYPYHHVQNHVVIAAYRKKGKGGYEFVTRTEALEGPSMGTIEKKAAVRSGQTERSWRLRVRRRSGDHFRYDLSWDPEAKELQAELIKD